MLLPTVTPREVATVCPSITALSSTANSSKFHTARSESRSVTQPSASRSRQSRADAAAPASATQRFNCRVASARKSRWRSLTITRRRSAATTSSASRRAASSAPADASFDSASMRRARACCRLLSA